ncbi:CvpA family protein [Oryzomicrobium sp.]|uniref:CvpA family protein n=1 Tax=Oryzomicrobium sp. TaxID=1911578 RepID=UPI0025F64A48|nr:CvpA family protein [Oryzomicrobium sp.]MCE1244250.1 CvpA family protein [Oryzomicrobium sp.]
MTYFDYAVIVILLCSVLLGAWRGVVGEVIALVAWVLAFFAARAFGDEVGAAFLTKVVADPFWRTVAGWVLVFFAVIALMALARLAAQGLLKALGLGFTDRALGVLFGLLRGALIVFVLVLLGGMTALPKQHWWANAQFAAPFETAVLASRPWLPSEVSKRIRFK